MPLSSKALRLLTGAKTTDGGDDDAVNDGDDDVDDDDDDDGGDNDDDGGGGGGGLGNGGTADGGASVFAEVVAAVHLSGDRFDATVKNLLLTLLVTPRKQMCRRYALVDCSDDDGGDGGGGSGGVGGGGDTNCNSGSKGETNSDSGSKVSISGKRRHRRHHRRHRRVVDCSAVDANDDNDDDNEDAATVAARRGLSGDRAVQTFGARVANGGAWQVRSATQNYRVVFCFRFVVFQVRPCGANLRRARC
jgi:hypothetical protein